MSQPKSGRARSVAVADHLWETLEAMAREMGVDRDALLNQAIFQLARAHGYLSPGQTVKKGNSELEEEAHQAPTNPEHAKGKRNVRPAPAREPEPEEDVEPEHMEDEELRAAVEDEAREPLNEFEEEQEAAEEGGEEQAPEEEPPEEQPEEEPEPQPEPPPPPKRRAAGKLALFVTVNNNRHPQRVSGERFLIGRGKHCNLVIDSNRVSREHAAISRQGNEIVIEDLKSSNGTWYNRQRIARRKIDDGDEFLLGTEKLTFSFRSG